MKDRNQKTRFRFPSLSQLLGLGRDTAKPEPAPEWVHPYPRKSPRLSGEEYRARYLDYTLDEAAHARAAGIGGGDL